mmetsp:Transcript_69002/g.121831  ORF Transcript_69002/g.121831 Transcript_69002/m.121831 type:complete len:206 (+) Transcript_69002:123-740(+)
MTPECQFARHVRIVSSYACDCPARFGLSPYKAVDIHLPCEVQLAPVLQLRQKLQDLDEQVDDVKVQVNAGHDMVVIAIGGDDLPCVKQDVPTEEDGSKGCLQECSPPTKDEVQQTPANEDDYTCKQPARQEAEVCLGDVCIKGEADEDRQCQERCLDKDVTHLHVCVGGADHTKGDGLEEGEGGQEHAVGRVYVLVAAERDHADN